MDNEPSMMVSDLAQPARRPEGAPRYSDVSMRLFRRRDGEELAAAEAFHVTRADWSYIKDADYASAVLERGWTFQGSTNAVTRNPAFAMHDADGSLVLDHFKREGRYWSDCNNSAYRDWYVQQLIEWVALGAQSLQRDEPTAVNQWALGDAVDFFTDVHARLDEHVGHHVPLSCNLAWNKSRFGGRGEPVTRLFDFGMSELGVKDVRPRFFVDVEQDILNRGKAIVYTSFDNLGVPLYRLAIAHCYAHSMVFVVPWDQFGGINRPRVFAKPAELADLYGFVRANAQYLEGYEEAATLYRGHQSQVAAGILDLASDTVCATVRAQPGEAAAPVVVHLIDEAPEPSSFTIRVHRRSIPGGGNVRATLRVPVPYDAEAHATAEANGDYGDLADTIELKVRPASDVDPYLVIDGPALNPWGMLVLAQG